MKIEQDKIFAPMRITLETEEEVSRMISILYSLKAPTETIHCPITRRLAYEFMEELRNAIQCVSIREIST